MRTPTKRIPQLIETATSWLRCSRCNLLCRKAASDTHEDGATMGRVPGARKVVLSFCKVARYLIYCTPKVCNLCAFWSVFGPLSCVPFGVQVVIRRLNPRNNHGWNLKISLLQCVFGCLISPRRHFWHREHDPRYSEKSPLLFASLYTEVPLIRLLLQEHSC